jgi:hydrogenase maturation protein HypF
VGAEMGGLRIQVRGVVQGVGFRPYVHSIATKHALSGLVRNEGDGVGIEVEGHPDALSQFRAELAAHPPAGARIASIRVEECASSERSEFVVAASCDPSGNLNFAPADVATCPDCLQELFDTSDRRYRYPFISCTVCGPRFTILTALPFDRERTKMAAFPLCPECRHEYEVSADRRFQSQTTACPVCGPRLSLLDAHGTSIDEQDPIAAVIAALRLGAIVAVKGIGGFHLACDAGSSAVNELRRRKHRDEKPLAVMVTDLHEAKLLCEISAEEAELLTSPARPIVLLKRRPGCSIADDVAPGTPLLGVMLAYTPLHSLLLHEFGGPLVMTSGNRSEEPIACDDTDAVRRLNGIADQFLTHNREIQSQCDDSVIRIVAGAPLPMRRSRGYAPIPLTMPLPCPIPILAVGGQLKSVFALGRNGHAILSQHQGDLNGLESYHAFTDAIGKYERLYRFRPAVIAHDRHPDYASTRYAIERADVRPIAIQHHHAHMAACMAENGLNESVIGVTLDGSGYGIDGTIWGGEFLLGDYRSFHRAAHLRPVPLPGGESAIREPWRIALAYLLDAGEGPELLADRIAPESLRLVGTMIEREMNSPLTSSAGRLFDAVASIIGLRDRVTFEGQAAIELEGLASLAGRAIDGLYPSVASPANNGTIQLDTRPIIAAVARDVRAKIPPPVIAQRFHTTLAIAIADVCRQLRDQSGLNAVVLSGGVFLNAILLTETLDLLAQAGFRAYRHSLVPSGDGGLCLGQLMIAAATLNCDNPPVPSL